jgi:hypothetical protein
LWTKTYNLQTKGTKNTRQKLKAKKVEKRVFNYGEKTLYFRHNIKIESLHLKVFLINAFKFIFAKLNINQFWEHFFTTREPCNIETDSKNQM